MNSNKPLIFLSFMLTLLMLVFIYFVAISNEEGKLQQGLKTQSFQIVNELKTTLERHSYLPALLSYDPAIKDLLKTGEQDEAFLGKQLRINLSLELTNNISESSVIYVMRPDGTTVASSNWESEQSFIGNNFSFRPYFQQATQNILGRYYAVGAISGERGYFFASSVHENEKIIGVVAVKVAIDDIEFTWGHGSTDFMVTDHDGIVFLSSQKTWNFYSLSTLSSTQNKKLIKSRRYGSQKIKPFQCTMLDSTDYGFQAIRLMGEDYEMLSQKMALADWDVRVLASHSSMKKSILITMLVSTLILLLLSALILLLLKTQLQRKKYQQQITEKLEKKVIARTQALKQTQEDLIQAAKMAALGQLSAGIAHEINNPLTAIRAYADNAKAFVQKDRLDMVESNLEEISALTESMATITKQLKSFSRKSKGQITRVSLDHAINSALSIVHPKLVSQGVDCHWGDKDTDIYKQVLADEVWLGQILVNLLTNAISAVQDNKDKNIWISIEACTEGGIEGDVESKQASQICVNITDNGAGISDTTLPHIFEPFFTTKPSSKGLGLGLSISFNLAKDMNGLLTVKNLETGGAQFMLCLPASEQDTATL